MAEIPPNVPGGVPPAPVPPKPGDAAKVQPKKETVRISLPPKPTAAPTIKLPSLPPGGPPSAGLTISVGTPAPAAGAAPAPPRPPTSAPAAPAPATPRPPTSTGAPRPAAAAAPASGSAPAPRPMAPSAAAKKLSGLDIGLAIAAGVIGLAAVVSVVLLLQIK